MSNERYIATPNLRAALAEDERSMGWLARKSDASWSLVSKAVRGERTVSSELAHRIAGLLGRDFFLLWDVASVRQNSADVSEVAA
jgi:hypothetical protein